MHKYLLLRSTEKPQNNDKICSIEFCRSKEFAALKSPNMKWYEK